VTATRTVVALVATDILYASSSSESFSLTDKATIAVPACTDTASPDWILHYDAVSILIRSNLYQKCRSLKYFLYNHLCCFLHYFAVINSKYLDEVSDFHSLLCVTTTALEMSIYAAAVDDTPTISSEL
jgi:hypothetical protein